MNWKRKGFICSMVLCFLFSAAQEPGQGQEQEQNNYPQDYFRHPLDIPMQLVANFGEIRNNHWHMGLDIRTNQRVNIPVYAAAGGYIAKVSIEPGGFGQAIYINHPNGLTTLYAHLNAFFPALAQFVRAHQYEKQSWESNIIIPPDLFPVNQGDFIALSGNTGASQGPHVHFEIRETSTDKCLNPLLFGFPVPDAVPPAVTRLAMYDRNKSLYHQSPRFFPLKKTDGIYSPGGIVKTGSNRVTFAISAVDRFSGSGNPNGIYSAAVFMDNLLQSEFVLNRISYKETRYLNAQIDYRMKAGGGPLVQHLCPMPCDTTLIYHEDTPFGVIDLPDDSLHRVRIEVRDVAQNTSLVEFDLQHDAALAVPYVNSTIQQFIPCEVNIYETERFELSTSEYAVYDTVNVSYFLKDQVTGGAVSPLHGFLSAAIPVHDSVAVRILPSVDITGSSRDRVVIKSVSGGRSVVQKAVWQGPWLAAKFRQFGTYQAFVDNQPPTVNAPVYDLRKASRLVFVPGDNLGKISSFRAEVDGQWLLFSNDKGRSWIYYFDEYFPPGDHELKVTVTDEAGNVTEKVWNVRR